MKKIILLVALLLLPGIESTAFSPNSDRRSCEDVYFLYRVEDLNERTARRRLNVCLAQHSAEHPQCIEYQDDVDAWSANAKAVLDRYYRMHCPEIK